MDYSFLMVAILFSEICVQEAKQCDTNAPSSNKCSTTLSVEYGTACYYHNKKYASISCDRQYSFDTAVVFECKDTKSWSPSATATCSPTVSPLYSTTHSKLPDITDSMFTTSFRSTLLPSESTVFSTSRISVTPSLKTAILQSDTVRTDYSTILQAELQTMSVTEAITSSSISASMQPVTDRPKEVKNTDIIALYITVPVVVCIIALIGVILFFLWRHRRRQSALKREKGLESSITNKTYEENHLDRHCSLIGLRTSLNGGVYTEIPLDTLHPEEASGNVYQTIDSLPEDQSGSNQTYGHLKQQTTKFTDMNYSHINTNKIVQQFVSDTTYAHTETAAESPKSKDSLDDTDSTYNRLNTIPTSMTGKNVPEKQGQENDNESEYNHAKSGSPDPENHADCYSHLNGSLQTQPTLTQKEKRQYHDNEKLTKFPTVEPYEFAKEPESPKYEFAKEPENPQYEFAKEPENSQYDFAKHARSQHYETAKDFDNLNRANLNRECVDKVAKQECEEQNQDSIGQRGYEKAVIGNANNYFILEPEDRPSSNGGSFHVAVDLSVGKDGTSDYTESANHQYFILEKTDT